MITLQSVHSADYYMNLADKTGHAAEYYSQKDEIKGTWSCTLADKMELTGKTVSKEDFERMGGLVGEGFDKENGQKRLGLDVTYSSPKETSLLYSLSGDNNILEAHKAAVEVTNKFIERELSLTRQGHAGKDKVEVSGIAVATFGHERNRANDPDLHSHSIIFNGVERSTDGKITALEDKLIFKQQYNLDWITKAAEAAELQKLGYKIEMTEHGYKIVGITREVVDKFSRAEEIKEAAKELKEKHPNINEAELKDWANKQIRPEKEFLTKEQLNAHDVQALREIGYTGKGEFLSRVERIDPSQLREPTHENIDSYLFRAASLLHENESCFSKVELYGVASRMSLSQAGNNERIATIRDLESSFDRLVSKGEIKDLSTQQGRGIYTTKEMSKIEKSVVEKVKDGRGKAEAISSAKEIEKEVSKFEKAKGFSLTQDQKNAVQHLLNTSDIIVGIQGDAGTGKTTSFELVGQELRSKGFDVHGLAPTGKAAAELSKTLGDGKTVHSFLKGLEKGTYQIVEDKERHTNQYNLLKNQILTAKEGKDNVVTGSRSYTIPGVHGKDWDTFTLTQDGKIYHTQSQGIEKVTKEYCRPDRTIQSGKSLYVVDEASMLGSKKMNELLSAAEKAGARVVVVGDTKQHQSISAGKIMQDMQKSGMSTARMSEVIRQTNKEYNAAARALSDKQFEKAESYLKNHTIEVKNNADKMSAIREEYKKTDHLKTHVCVSTNKEKNEINTAIRADLRVAGKIGQQDHNFNCRESKNLGAEARTYSFNYKQGDSITTSRPTAWQIGCRDKSVNEFLVKEIDQKNNTLTLSDKWGNQYKFDLEKHGRDKELAVYKSSEKEFSKNEKVITLKNDSELEVKNGQTWEVKSIDQAGNVTLKNQSGEKSFNVRDYNYLDHGYATTSHKAQGMSTGKVIDVATGRTDFNKEYVNITRGKEDVTIITSDKEKYFKDLKNEHIKSSTLDKKQNEKTESLDSEKTNDRSRGDERGEDRGKEENLKDSREQTKEKFENKEREIEHDHSMGR